MTLFDIQIKTTIAEYNVTFTDRYDVATFRRRQPTVEQPFAKLICHQFPVMPYLIQRLCTTFAILDQYLLYLIYFEIYMNPKG